MCMYLYTPWFMCIDVGMCACVRASAICDVSAVYSHALCDLNASFFFLSRLCHCLMSMRAGSLVISIIHCTLHCCGKGLAQVAYSFSYSASKTQSCCLSVFIFL